MKYRRRAMITFVSLLLLTGCSFSRRPQVPEDSDSSSLSSVSLSSEDVVETEEVTYEGQLLRGDVSIYMEGTHRLLLGDGEYILLQSDIADLDEYVSRYVRVTGTVRSTVEGGGKIMRVNRIVTLLQDDIDSEPDTETGSMSSSIASSEAVPVSNASSSAERVAVKASSSAPKPATSSAPKQESSSKAASIASSVSAINNEGESPTEVIRARAATMSKAKNDPSNWSQQYCTSHVGFCIPVHRNWWFNSFGATTSYLWHVELSSEEIENMGDGPIVINLIAGPLPDGISDGSIREQGDYAIGYRAWTGKRHFEISAPLSLKAAVSYVTSNLTTYDGPLQ